MGHIKRAEQGCSLRVSLTSCSACPEVLVVSAV